MNSGSRLFWVSIAQGLAIVLRMALAVAIARVLTTEEFGAYSVVMNVVAVATVVTMGGWPSYLLAVAPKSGLSLELMNRALLKSSRTLLFVVILEMLALGILLGDEGTAGLLVAAALLLAGMTLGGIENEGLRATNAVSSPLVSLRPCFTRLWR